MEITGKIIEIHPEVQGEGKNGPWKRQDFILETEDQFPRKVCISVWGNRIDLKSYQVNEKITASINIESREFNGKWFTSVKAWRLDKAGATGAIDPEYPPPPDFLPPDDLPGEQADDLPF
ncbi:MAG: DUF3127 domain-containing protein [Bacteroidales bacterium]|nr:DUF3127 domain-containing protein [Bacteroidales bacterium]